MSYDSEAPNPVVGMVILGGLLLVLWACWPLIEKAVLWFSALEGR